jgi:hypothetical protein
MNKFDSLLADLENEASTSLDDKMNPFVKKDNSKAIACPWLNWRKDYTDATPGKIQGVFIMQDWWCSSEPKEKDSPEKSLEYHVDYIRKNNFSSDPTIKNLWNAPSWKKAIWENKTWLVTNAVWGLRKGNISSGYLGDTIHKAAFPIWAKLISHFAGNNKDFKVVFAGGWAVFENAKFNDKNLNQYLKNWEKWAGKGTGKNDEVSKLGDTNVYGNAYFCCHPSVWNSNFNCLKGPPPNRV